MKNVDELYKKYYNAYKSDYDTDDELKKDKKKIFNCKQFELDDEINKESKLDEKTKELELTELPKWLSSKNDFNEARKLINDIGADTNKVKSSSGDEKVFNDLNGLINDIQNKKTKRESTIKKIRKIISDLDEQRQKESTVFQNKMIDVAYYLFNAFGITTNNYQVDYCYRNG